MCGLFAKDLVGKYLSYPTSVRRKSAVPVKQSICPFNRDSNGMTAVGLVRRLVAVRLLGCGTESGQGPLEAIERHDTTTRVG